MLGIERGRGGVAEEWNDVRLPIDATSIVGFIVRHSTAFSFSTSSAHSESTISSACEVKTRSDEEHFQ